MGILVCCVPASRKREVQSMVEVVMPLKDRVRELRKAAGLTQQALATKAGLSVSVVQHIERGAIPDPRSSTAKALARALGATVDELLSDDEAPPAGQGKLESKKPRRGRRKS
jgi:transcriptional regulator with XRE-family HTH domain